MAKKYAKNMSGVFLFLTLSFILPGLICFRFVCVLFSTLLKPFSVTISKVKAQTITLLYSDCVLVSFSSHSFTQDGEGPGQYCGPSEAASRWDPP